MSNVLSSREKKIINTILTSSTGITLQEISNEIGVSRRTILREMSSIYDWFTKKGFNVERHSSKGIFLHVTEQEKRELQNELNEEQIIHYYNKKERTLYIITELLQSKDPLKLSYFSTVLDVSEASISSDLNRVEEWLDKYSLTLERKQGYGIQVIGRERDKRRALVNIIYDTLDSNQLRNAVQRQLGMENKIKVTSKIRLNLLNMIDVNTITIIEGAINKSEKEIGFKFTESSYTALAVHLALACKRIVNNENISIRPDILDELKLQDEYLIAARLIKSLKIDLNIDIPDDEIGYVTLHLKGARYKNGLFDSNMLRFNETIISNYELTSMINKMIKIASLETGYNLRDVDSLLIGLVDHLRPAINRIQLNLDIRNPLLDKIKAEYLDIFNISKKCTKVLEDELGIILPESELGYIAMHIGSAVEQLKNKKVKDQTKFNVIVTCISGIGTSNMLAERLKKEIKNINILEVFSSTNVKDEWLNRNEVDLILSTVHFENNTVPVLTVNPLLPENDIKKVNQKLNTLTILRKPQSSDNRENFYDRLQMNQKYSSSILEVLDNLTIKSGLTCTSYNELLDTIVGEITDNHQELLDDFERREAIGKIVFDDDYVSFIHARSDSVEKLYIGIFRNKNIIIDQEHHYDTVLVLVAPKDIEKYKLEIMGEISARVVSEENFLRDLRFDSEEGLYKKIQHFLSQFFNKKMKNR